MRLDTAKRDRVIRRAIDAGAIPIDKAPLWAAAWDQAPRQTEQGLERAIANPASARVTEDEMRELFPGRAFGAPEPTPVPSAEDRAGAAVTFDRLTR